MSSKPLNINNNSVVASVSGKSLALLSQRIKRPIRPSEKGLLSQYGRSVREEEKETLLRYRKEN